MTTTNATAKTTRPLFEAETCSRCGGSGRYSYCPTMNGPHGPWTCFRCQGQGACLTKRGVAAAEFYRRLRSKDAREIKAGDKVFIPGHGWGVVESVEIGTTRYGKGEGDAQGGIVWYDVPTITIRTNKVRTTLILNDKTERIVVAHGAERLAAMQAEALAFQETLTKAGTVRKTPVRKAVGTQADAVADREACRAEALAAI